MKNKNKKQDKLVIITTGGTIDSYYEGTMDTVMPLKKSVVPTFLKSLKLDDEIVFTEVCMKDSRSLNINDMKKILNHINHTKLKKIIITHGTYTMPDTARYLASNLKKKGQVIILTGSMILLTGFAPSDAPFNLGYSLSAVKYLLPGVYVCMNGQIFTHQEVAKRISEGKFVSVFNK